MFRKKQVDRIIDAWKTLDHAPNGPEYDRAWAVITAAERNASADERNAASEVVSRAPWKRK